MAQNIKCRTKNMHISHTRAGPAAFRNSSLFTIRPTGDPTSCKNIRKIISSISYKLAAIKILDRKRTFYTLAIPTSADLKDAEPLDSPEVLLPLSTFRCIGTKILSKPSCSSAISDCGSGGIT